MQENTSINSSDILYVGAGVLTVGGSQNVSVVNLGDNRFIVIYDDSGPGDINKQAETFGRVLEAAFPGSQVFVMISHVSDVTFTPLQQSATLRDLLRSLVRELMRDEDLGDHR